MKKVFILICFLVISFSLIGCANPSKDNSSSFSQAHHSNSFSPTNGSSKDQDNNTEKNHSISEQTSDKTAPQKDEKLEEAPKRENKPEINVNNDQFKTYEENKKQHETEVEIFLKENNINANTAGETGEICPHCGKKIWNPNKYGLGNPGRLDNYAQSGYCYGTCGIKVG